MRIRDLQREAKEAWDLINNKQQHAEAMQRASTEHTNYYYLEQIDLIDKQLKQFSLLNMLNQEVEILKRVNGVDVDNRRFVIRIGGRMIYGGMFNDLLIDGLKNASIPSERVYDPVHHIWVFEYHKGLWLGLIDNVLKNRIDRIVFISDRDEPISHVIFDRKPLVFSQSAGWAMSPYLIPTRFGQLAVPEQGVWAKRGRWKHTSDFRGSRKPPSRPTVIIIDDVDTKTTIKEQIYKENSFLDHLANIANERADRPKEKPPPRRPPAPDNSLYSVLEVYFDATAEEITKAFRKKARLYHPDTSSSPNTQMFQKSLSAYQTLKDEERRKRYNAMLRLTNQLSYDDNSEKDSDGFYSGPSYPF